MQPERLLRAGELLAQAARESKQQERAAPLRQQLEAEIDAFCQQNGCYGTPDEAHRCSERCVGKIRCMPGQRPVFLCPAGGRVHVCDGSEPHPVTIIDENGQSVCLISSIIVAAKSFAPGRTEAARFRLGKGYAAKQDIEIDEEGSNSGEGVLLTPVISSSGEKNNNSPEKQAADLLSLAETTPSSAASAAAAPDPGLSPPDYDDQLRRYREQQKALGEMLKRRDSAATKSSSSAAAAAHSPSKKQRRTVRQTIRDDDMHRTALETLGTFFNYERMAKTQAEAEAKIDQEISDRVVKHVKQEAKKGFLPLRRDLDNIAHEVRSRRRVRVAQRVDQRVLEEWARSISAIWRVLKESPYLSQQQQGRVSKVEFVLGALFWLRDGYRDDGIEVVPPDADLAALLPQAPDFEQYGFKETHMTRGRNLVRNAIASYKTRLSVMELRNKFME